MDNTEIVSVLGSTGDFDIPTRTIYFHDADTNEFWALGWQPTRHQTERYTATHGLGETTIESTGSGIDSQFTLFVPENDPLEIWQLQLSNTSNRKRRINVFAVANWALNEEDRPTSSVLGQILMARGRQTNGDQSALFFTSDRSIQSFDTLRDVFFGRWGDPARPEAVIAGKCSRSVGQGKTIGVIQRTITLGPKSSSQTNFFVGAVATSPRSTWSIVKKSVESLTAPYRRIDGIAKAKERVQTTLRRSSRQSLLHSPENHLNHFYNHFWSYQSLLHRRWPAIGANGPQPANSQSQADTIQTLLAYDVQAARVLLEENLAFELKDGRVADSWLGEKIEIIGNESVRSSLALGASILSYLKETGELDFLKTTQPFFDGANGTVLEHLSRLLRHVESQLDTHHLVRLGETVSPELTGKYAWLLRELRPLFHQLGDVHFDRQAAGLIEKMQRGLEKQLWRSGRIGVDKDHWHLPSQTWPIIGGLVANTPAKKLLREIGKHSCSRLPLSLTPPYDQPLPNNRASHERPGEGENGGVVSEQVLAASWAAAVAGDGDLAWEILSALIGQSALWESDQFRVSGNWLIEEFQRFHPGRGEVVLREQIIGLSPTLHGLKIDPCLPKTWRQVEISRTFRGADYHIRIHNPFRINKGVDRIAVDGIRLTGNVIRPFRTGSHFIEVTLG